MTDDPSAWLGDPIVSHATGAGSVYIHVPPGSRSMVVLSIIDAASPIADAGESGVRDQNAFLTVNLEGALNLRRGLDAAIAQLQEHDG